MIGFRIVVIACVAALVFAAFPFLFAQGPTETRLPISWEERYTTLDDDLQAVAIDPLNSSIIYMGTDKELLVSTDRGLNWSDLHSFADNLFTIPDRADRDIFLAVRFFTGAATEEEFIDRRREPVAPKPVEEPAAREETVVEQVVTQVPETPDTIRLEEQLASARAELSAAEAGLTSASAARQAWTPDSIRLDEVEGLPIEGGFLDQPYYGELGERLAARGLAVPEAATERRDILSAYLNARAREGANLDTALQQAQQAVVLAQARVASLQSELGRLAAPPEMVEEVRGVEAPVGAEEVVREEPAVEVREEITRGVTAIAVDPANPANIYLSTFQGIYKSADRGQTWEEVYQGISPLESAVLDLAIDPSNPSVIFAGSLRGAAISRDSGATWEIPAGEISETVINTIAIHPFDSNIALLGTQNQGIFRSTDGGHSWAQVALGHTSAINSVHALAFAAARPNLVFAGTEDGIYFSLDAGASWSVLPAAGLPERVVKDIAVCPLNPDRLFLVAPISLYGSLDGGRSWRRLTYGDLFHDLRRLALDPLNPGVAWLTSASRTFQSLEIPKFDLSRLETVAFAGSAEFTLDGRAPHALLIETVNEVDGRVVFNVHSVPRNFEIGIGETIKLDLDESGYDNLAITLEEIRDGIPVLRLEKLKPLKRPGLVLKSAEEISDLEDFDNYFLAEPTWTEVQEVAGRYAEVNPERIEAWRRGDSLRALLPTVRLTFDQDERDDIRTRLDLSEQDRYRTDDRTDYQTWDDERVTDRFRFWSSGTYTDYYSTRFEDRASSIDDRQWDYRWRERDRWREEEFNREQRYLWLRLDWRLRDLLYSRGQVQISTEARRYLVPHRKAVLDQVTNHYFNRRRLRIDMILNPPADSFTRMEMLLRLQEIDFRLDALTGGYFTRTIKERERKYPELANYTRAYGK